MGIFKTVLTLTPLIIALNHKSDFLFRVVRILSDTDFHENTVYIGYESQVQNTIRLLKNITLFLIKDMNELSIPLEHSNSIVLFPDETDINVLFDKCSSSLMERALLLENSFLLFNQFISTDNLENLVDLASRIIHNPIIVIDTSFKVLTYSSAHEVSDSQWQQNINRGYCSFEYIAGFNSIQGVKTSQNSNEPFFINCHTSPLRRCISKLYFNNLQVGYAIVIESHSSFDDMDLELFTMISNTLAKIIDTNNKLALTSNNKDYDSIFVDCLNGSFKNSTDFFDRMEKTDFPLHSSYILFVVDIQNYNNYDYSGEHLKQHITRSFVRSWSISYKNSVTVLFDVGKNEEKFKSLLKSTKEYFRSNKLRMGISDVFTNIFNLPRFYKQAYNTLQIAAKLSPDETFVLYDDYKFYDLILSTEKKNEIETFFVCDLIKIKQYDQDHNSDYYDTLYTYIICDRKLDLVANHLHIHKNTVSYRISKLKDIFNINFDDPHKRFQLYYSYILSKMLEKDLL